MKRNVGGFDRVIRVVVGVGIIAAGVYYNSWWGALGAIPLLTAITGRCMAYVPFGVSTCTKKPGVSG
jgi:hypothetical protein